MGRLVGIYLAPRAKDPMQRVSEAVAEADRGLVGDRYHAGTGAMSRWPGTHRDISIISAEALAEASRVLGASIDAAATRRNLVVSDVALDVLIGHRFRIGCVTLEGVQLCHPCAYVERVSGVVGLLGALARRGGLRARIVEGGVLRDGDEVHVPDGG